MDFDQQREGAQDLSSFEKELLAFGRTVLPLEKVLLAFHASHPEHTFSADLRARLREAILDQSEAGYISIDDKAWDDHPTLSLPKSVLLLRS